MKQCFVHEIYRFMQLHVCMLLMIHFKYFQWITVHNVLCTTDQCLHCCCTLPATHSLETAETQAIRVCFWWRQMLSFHNGHWRGVLPVAIPSPQGLQIYKQHQKNIVYNKHQSFKCISIQNIYIPGSSLYPPGHYFS